MKDAIWLNEYFRLALEASPVGQVIVDRHGIIRHVNDKVMEIFGYKRDEIKGKELEELVPKELRILHHEHRGEYSKNPAVRNMGTGQVLYGLHMNGQKIPIEVGLVPLIEQEEDFVLATVVDITERHKSQRRFELTLEASPSGLMLVNDVGRIELVNSKIEEIFGYRREELIGANLEMLVPDAYQATHPSFVEHFISEPRARAMGAGRDLYGLHKSGKEIPVEIGLNPLEIDGRIHVLASVVDNSERKKSEKEKKLLDEHLQHMQRMESLGVLAGGTAHDFNNILAAIAGNAELIRLSLGNEVKNRGKIISYVEKIVRSCQRAEGLTNQMLAYAGKVKITKEDVLINDIVNDMLGILTSIVPKQISLITNLSPGMLPISADRSQVQQVVLNLVTNAFEAIGDADGMIHIISGTEYYSRDKLLKYKAVNQNMVGEYQFLEVKDDGCGMSKEVIDNIFDPFFTTKFAGRGLGMASVLGIIRSHHAGIHIESGVDTGTAIKIIFPEKMSD